MKKILSLAFIGMAALAVPVIAQTSEHNSKTMYASDFKIGKITMAVTNVEQMVRFYDTMFDARFRAFDAYGTTLYQGKFLDFVLLMCPNTIAGTVAEQNRHQFDIIVQDIDEVVRRAKEVGGTVRDDTAPGGPATMTVTDPDGNTIVFIQKK